MIGGLLSFLNKDYFTGFMIKKELVIMTILILNRIEKREDCEMILLIGLPAAGKTTWAAKRVQENPDKRYYVIGTNALIERMKV